MPSRRRQRRRRRRRHRHLPSRRRRRRRRHGHRRRWRPPRHNDRRQGRRCTGGERLQRFYAAWIAPRPLTSSRPLIRSPLCAAAPLARKELRAHVTEAHSGAKHAVVCPMCAAAPGGDLHRKSADFVAHMKHRHGLRRRGLHEPDSRALSHPLSLCPKV